VSVLLLQPGSRVRVEVYIKDPPLVFTSTVRSSGSDSFEISAPSIGGKRIGVPPDTRVTVIESSHSGLLILDTDVEGIHTKPETVWVIRIPDLEGIRRIQRRREPRYEIDLHVRWKTLEDKNFENEAPVHIININSNGALLIIEHPPLDVHDAIHIDLTPLIQVGGRLEGQKTITGCKVVRIAREGGKVYGVTFDNLERMEKVHLMDAIRRLKSRIV
jgi:c-di-GMP-binding flagellar brake protein YcgR